MGYKNVMRYPSGYLGWLKKHTEKTELSAESKVRPVSGDIFPPATLRILEGQKDRSYLQLTEDTEQVELKNIPAENLAVLIFNTLCSGCVQNIRAINAFVEAHPDTTVKFIAIASGDTAHKTRRFRHQQNITFPLFNDTDRILFRQLGLTYMPVLYLLKKQPDGTYKITDLKAGILTDDAPILTKTLSIQDVEAKAK